MPSRFSAYLLPTGPILISHSPVLTLIHNSILLFPHLIFLFHCSPATTLCYFRLLFLTIFLAFTHNIYPGVQSLQTHTSHCTTSHTEIHPPLTPVAPLGHHNLTQILLPWFSTSEHAGIRYDDPYIHHHIL